MFGKLVFIILTLGATACALLVIRQQRIELAHEMSEVHQRMIEHEQTEWRFRSELAALTRPEHIREAMDRTEIAWKSMELRPWRDWRTEIRLAGEPLTADDPEPDFGG